LSSLCKRLAFSLCLPVNFQDAVLSSTGDHVFETGRLAKNANSPSVEGFLSLEEAAERLQTSAESLSAKISAGQVVAIVKDDGTWLSPGEVSRLSRSKNQASPAPSSPPPAAPEPPPPAPPKEAPSADTQALRSEIERLKRQNGELTQVNERLKVGLQETEASLRKSRNAKTNLENDIISLQEEVKKAHTRSGALEREVQHLTHELERAEEKYSAEVRRLRSRELNPNDNPSERESSEAAATEIAALRQQMEEKDRIISQEYQERQVLRNQLDDRSQKYYELKARYEKEKAEWSEILARELQNHGRLKSQIEELRPSSKKGWNPFRRDR